MDSSMFLFVATQYFLFFSILLPSSASFVHNNITDLEALLAFKAGVSDPNGILSTTWNINTSFCTWIGVSCSHRRQRVVALEMDNITLSGTISPHVANLSFLSILNLNNNTLRGPIPNSLAQMPRLTVLKIQMNQLSGSIPPAIFNMSKLTELVFLFNSLSGTLPSNHTHPFNLPQIQFLSLSQNNLSGYIPSAISHCTNLRIISLSYNNFMGSIPSDLGNLQQLQHLYLGANNLSSTIPTSFGNLTDLTILDLAGNYIHGIIPKELGGLSLLQVINLVDSYLTGPVPTSFSNMSSLEIIDLGDNYLTGPIEVEFGNMPNLKTLLIPENQLTGGFEFLASLSKCRNLEIIDLDRNELSGILPDTIGNFSDSFILLILFSNHIKGKIPVAVCNLTSLWILQLGYNELDGMLPSDIINLESLQYLNLYENRLYGPLPGELGGLRFLNRLNLGGNKFSGSIPDSLGNVSGLQYITLNDNAISSRIPEFLWNLTGLIELEISQNLINGALSSSIGNLKFLDTLNASMNQLSGDIPSAFEELQMLTSLDLSNNSFGGLIPKSFGKLISIVALNLSCNNLTGIIPDSLVSLRYLKQINFSFNNLEGKIPNGGVFSNLTVSSLEGNVALCGAPLLGFPPCPTNDAVSSSGKRMHFLKYMLPAVASAILLLACIYIFLIKSRQKKTSDQASSRNSTLSANYNHRVISYYELIRATENFSMANLLGRGSFGSVYRGSLDDGLLTAIKVLNLEVDGASKSFDVECQALCVVRHRNLVKIISSCSNLDFKAIVLQYMPNGSLEKWLYSHNYLNLLQRINIVLDIASAMEYLHHHHSHVVVHCDLKPNNVLLDENMTAHVGDFGIAKLLLGDIFSLRSASMLGTIGYMAPEYATAGRISAMGDVYSFGILLLEIITRKKPTDPIFVGELSLRKWVCEAHPTALLEVVDNNLLQHNVGNENPIEDLNYIHECLSSMLELGMVCSSDSPKERLPMIEVVPKLHKIKKDYLSKYPNV